MEIQAIIETAIYAEDLHAAEVFYSRVLGLESIAVEQARHVFFRVGSQSMLLIFDPRNTIQGHLLPAHGASGPGHLALGVSADSLPAWRERLAEHEVAIEKEVDWPRGGRSLYFRDPAGDSVELITPGVWGLPSGW